MEEKNENIAFQLLNGMRAVLPEKVRASDNQELNRTLLNNPLFQNLMKSSPSGIAIFSYETMTYEYFSPNIEDILGYPMDKLQGISGSEFAINTFHPDHLNVIVKVSEVIKKYYYEYSLQQRVIDTRFTWTVQLKKGDGKYIWTMQQTMVLEVTPDGFPLRTLIFVSDITDVKTTTKVDFVFSIKNINGNGFETLYASHHETSKEYKLSGREIDVLNCVAKGMRNQEIADNLNISKHTVITHRKNIMKKSGKDNIIQLLME